MAAALLFSAAQGRAQTPAEKVYSGQPDTGDLSAFLDSSGACASHDKLADFAGYINVSGQPSVKGNVQAVCRDHAYISASNLPGDAAPATGFIQDKSGKTIVLTFDSTEYKTQIVTVTSTDLARLCGSAPCTSTSITATVTSMDNRTANATVIGVNQETVLVRFTAAKDFQLNAAVLSGAGRQTIASPVQGSAGTRILSARADFKGLGYYPDNSRQCLIDTELATYTAFVYAGSRLVPATVRAFCRDQVIVSSAALGASDKPVSGLLQSPGIAPALLEFESTPYRVFTVSLSEKNLSGGLCNGVCTPEIVRQLEVVLIPGLHSKTTGAEGPKVLTIDNNLAAISYVAPADFELDYVTIRNRTGTGAGTQVTARLLTGPRPLATLPNASFAMVSTKDVRENFGHAFANQYIVVDLTVKNPGVKKVQLKKSALWFEVDYVKTRNDGKLVNNAADGKVYRYGLDHIEQQTPETWETTLGTFDALDYHDRILGLKGIDLVVTTLSALSGTGIRSRGMDQVLPKLAGVVVPSIKDTFFSEDDEKRRRLNLLGQTFDDIIQIAAGSSITTKIFLPKRGLLRLMPVEPRTAAAGSKAEQVEVTIDSVRNVHLDLEVVTDAVTEDVVKGKLSAGMTKDTVVQALGIPDSKTDGAKLASTWTYNSGPFKQVAFGADGTVSSWQERTVTDQLDQGAGKLSDSDVKLLLGISADPANKQPLWDNGSIWPNAGGTGRMLRFSKDRILSDANYALASDKNNGFTDDLKALPATAKLEDAQSAVSDKLASYFPEGKANRPAGGSPPTTSGSTRVSRFSAPDVRNQVVTVTFTNANSAFQVTSVSVDPAKF